MRRRILGAGFEIAALAVIYAAAFLLVRETRVAEVLLASGGADGAPLVIVAAAFMALRVFVVLFAPGWVLSVVFLRVVAPVVWSDPKNDRADRRPASIRGRARRPR